ERQRLDVHLARDLGERAALLHAGRLVAADELDDHRGLDRLVEPHLLEVDVDDGASDRVLLEVLEDRRARGLLALEDDVEDRVHPRPARAPPPQLALRNRDRVRRLAASVDDTRNEALTA